VAIVCFVIISLAVCDNWVTAIWVSGLLLTGVSALVLATTEDMIRKHERERDHGDV